MGIFSKFKQNQQDNLLLDDIQRMIEMKLTKSIEQYKVNYGSIENLKFKEELLILFIKVEVGFVFELIVI